jgi:hypothetical protein
MKSHEKLEAETSVLGKIGQITVGTGEDADSGRRGFRLIQEFQDAELVSQVQLLDAFEEHRSTRCIVRESSGSKDTAFETLFRMRAASDATKRSRCAGRIRMEQTREATSSRTGLSDEEYG